jgi:hypothetical protein
MIIQPFHQLPRARTRVTRGNDRPTVGFEVAAQLSDKVGGLGASFGCVASGAFAGAHPSFGVGLAARASHVRQVALQADASSDVAWVACAGWRSVASGEPFGQGVFDDEADGSFGGVGDGAGRRDDVGSQTDGDGCSWH